MWAIQGLRFGTAQKTTPGDLGILHGARLAARVMAPPSQEVTGPPTGPGLQTVGLQQAQIATGLEQKEEGNPPSALGRGADSAGHEGVQVSGREMRWHRQRALGCQGLPRRNRCTAGPLAERA